ncbi:FBX42 protein, partial [Polyodon spathula]|nr:FBX42 protein [Polyodon spathula]
MASSSDSEDDSFIAMDTEEAVEGSMDQDEEPQQQQQRPLEVEQRHHRTMGELPEEVLEYILSFLSPYQEHKTAALVCKQWYRLIKGVAHQCYHGFIKAVQEGNIQWESRTYPYPGTPITQRFSHSACYYDSHQSMYVFGGCTQSSCNAAFNDLWRLDLNSKEWIRPLASGKSATEASRDKQMFAFQFEKEGRDNVATSHLKVRSFSDKEALKPGSSRYAVTPDPCGHCSHSLISQAVLGSQAEACRDVRVPTARENRLEGMGKCPGEIPRGRARNGPRFCSYPSPKAGATLVVYRDLLVLFGGWTRPSPYPLHQPERFFDEIHTYSPSKNWWNCIVTTQGPPPMAGHSSSVIGDRMIVFGGSLGSRQMSNEVWVLDLEQWSWSKPNIAGPTPHPRGGQSQIVIDEETLLILGGCGGPNALLKDAWLLRMHANPWAWQQLKVENEEHGAPELWCHPACRVGQCVVVFSQAPSGRAPLSPSMNSRPSPISATPPSLMPEQREYRSHSPVKGGDEVPCESPGQASSPGTPSGAEGYDFRTRPTPETQDLRPADYSWDPKAGNPDSPEAKTTTASGRDPTPEQINGIHTPPSLATTPQGAVSPGALRRGLEAVKGLSSQAPPPPAVPLAASGSSPPSAAAAAAPSPAQADGHSIPPIARRLGHHPPQSLNVGKPLYQSMNCKPMQMYVLDVSRVKERGQVSWKVFGGGSVVGPPETSLHTVVQGRGELIIFGGLMDKKQNVKYYPKTNALYFVRAKR